MDSFVDPLDATTSHRFWVCPVCTLDIQRKNTYCNVCLRSRPMDRHGVPQVFAGYKIHFNGVIPRTIMHPSHSVEWRMAERHGATCILSFDVSQVNLLVYRPGYERSDKVRRCVEGETSNIPAVPITWMLDCLLQSRQIHPALYRLTSIPAVAQPTGKGLLLPHHQHPYYLMNKEEYAIPTSFPEERKPSKTAKGSRQSNLPVDIDLKLPPFFEPAEPQYTNVNIFQAVCNVEDGNAARDDDQDSYGDAREARKRTANLELLRCEQRQNRIDKFLFSGMFFLLTPSLESDPQVTQALKMCGAKIASRSDGDTEKLLRTFVTHVLYDNSEKKSNLMILASQAKKELPGLTLAQINWVEDCLMLGEIIPPYGNYAPTAKLLETLSKKFERM